MHRVRSGEVLGRIAMKYRVSVSQIKRWNGLKSDNIRVGQKLIVYRGGKAPVTASSGQPAKQTTVAKAPQVSKPGGEIQKTSGTNYTVYVVKSGESLYSIAKKFPGVSAQNIMDFNGIGSNIRPGMKIRIPKL
ncbi:membrane-bound lytic murein transglycosylase [gut metagenome]|uniref:Membrane-bound lytic murein transglycosylase n=1 Tax=gut metagenome TaxID=749906 RepID=J9CM27_9ZZZZ